MLNVLEGKYDVASFDHATSLRICMSAIGYSIRPANIFIVILLLLRQRKKKLVWLIVTGIRSLTSCVCRRTAKCTRIKENIIARHIDILPLY